MTAPTKRGSPVATVKPDTAPDKPAAPAPRTKDVPRTMRDLRISRESRRRGDGKRSALQNPLREGLRLEKVPDPAALVLFGATGDLAHRKVIPALYHLWRTNLLPHEFILLAIGRRDYDDEAFRKEIHESLQQYSRLLPLDEAAWKSFNKRIRYHR